MSRDTQLDRPTVNFLLEAMEAPESQITAAALLLRASSEGNNLIKRGYIVCDGYEALTMSSDFRDRLVSPVWSDESESFGYFDTDRGWVKVDHDELKRFRIDMDRVISALTSRFDLPSNYRRRVLVDNLLWDLGDVRFGKRTSRTAVFFARRLSHPASSQLVQYALRSRPLDQPYVLLTSTPSEHLASVKLADVISLQDVLDQGLILDPKRVSAYLDRRIESSSPNEIVILADGKEVRFFGKSFSFPKGAQQRRILQLLYKNYKEGEFALSVDYVVAQLGLRSNARIRDYFRKHPAWGVMLFEKDGTCGFVLNRAGSPPVRGK